MGSDKADVDDPIRVIYSHDEAVLVPTDVEAHAVVFEDAGVGVVPFDSRRTGPIRGAGKLKPSPQRLPSVSVLFPVGSEGLPRDDPYGSIYAAPKLGSSKLFPFRERSLNRVL